VLGWVGAWLEGEHADKGRGLGKRGRRDKRGLDGRAGGLE
jgi:hypothetical protein